MLHARLWTFMLSVLPPVAGTIPHAQTSIWYGCVLRGDLNRVKVGGLTARWQLACTWAPSVHPGYSRSVPAALMPGQTGCNWHVLGFPLAVPRVACVLQVGAFTNVQDRTVITAAR